MAISACDDVPAFLEQEGVPLRIEPVEPGVRRATSDELLQNLRAMMEGSATPAAAEPAGRLALRRKRLAAIRARLKERRAELEREGDRLRAERLQFEAERSRFNGAREAVADQRDRLAKTRDKDAERMKALFCKPARPSAETPPSSAAPVNAFKISSEAKEGGQNAAIADSMEQLMGRMQSGQTSGSVIVDPDEGRPQRRPAETESRSDSATGPQTGSDPSSESPPNLKKARPRPNYHEIRAGVGSLREIANLSARTAVARHTSRKLRQSVAITLPLSIISFVLAGVLYLIGGTDAKFYSQAFGTVMLGAIVLIELVHSFCKMKRLSSPRVSGLAQSRDNAPGAAPFDDATSLTPAVGDQPQDEPPAVT
jgi:hypothetical protein